MKINRLIAVLVTLAAANLCGCKSMYYGTMEKFGVHKRDLLVDEVKDTRNSQQAAQEQFKTALEKYKEVVKVEGGDLEKKYNTLSKELARSESRAQEVKDHIASVEGVSEDLFREWKTELKQYSDPQLRRASEQQLRATQERYDDMMAIMKASAAKMDPVLAVFRDQVLFLKHNLNSRAIAGLQDESARLQSQVADLVRDMEKSIAEADAFIRETGLLDK